MPTQVIGDESGTKGSDRDFVMAGLIGRAEDWAQFSDEWSRCLDAFPTIGHFKMYDADHRTGEFTGFSDEMRDRKIEALARIVTGYGFQSLYISVEIAGVVEHVGKHTISRGQPYFLAFNSFIGAACFELWSRGETEHFEVIFDENPKFGQRAKRWFPAVRNLMPNPMRSILPVEPLFKDDKDFVPLQAADMIAWFARRGIRSTPHRFLWLAPIFATMEISRESRAFNAQQLAEILTAGKTE